MNLSERLRCWAQNEEMVDQRFTAHGRDCNDAAQALEGAKMTACERDLCNAIACAIGDLAAIERATGRDTLPGPLRDIRVRAQHAQRDLIRALGSTPMAEAPAPQGGALDLATLARNAGVE